LTLGHEKNLFTSLHIAYGDTPNANSDMLPWFLLHMMKRVKVFRSTQNLQQKPGTGFFATSISKSRFLGFFLILSFIKQ